MGLYLGDALRKVQADQLSAARKPYDAGNKTGQPYRDELISQGATAAQLDDDTFLQTRWQPTRRSVDHPSRKPTLPTVRAPTMIRSTAVRSAMFRTKGTPVVRSRWKVRAARDSGGQKRKSKEQWQLETQQARVISPSTSNKRTHS